MLAKKFTGLTYCVNYVSRKESHFQKKADTYKFVETHIPFTQTEICFGLHTFTNSNAEKLFLNQFYHQGM